MNMDDKDIHKGHRERIINKFINNFEGFSDHELLEIMLFPVVPRKDTNALAHRILRIFGDLPGVFRATPKELMTVSGVGERVASHISVTGRIFEAIRQKENRQGVVKRFYNFSESRKNLAEYFDGLAEERLIILLLDGKYKCLTQLVYDNGGADEVSGDAPEIAKAVALYKPRFALVAHNHPSGCSTPSSADDFSTKKLNAILSMHGVTLTDHIIIGRDEAFSYHVSGRMQYIKDCSDSENLFKNIID